MKKEEILNAIEQRKQAAARARLINGTKLHKILLESQPMPQGIWDKSCDTLIRTGFFGTDGKATQKPVTIEDELIMESEGYGISPKQLKQFTEATKARESKIAPNNDKLRKGVAGFARTKDCEIKNLVFKAGVTGKKKASLSVTMTATPTKNTVSNLTI
jgi:hypothetical protein